MTTIYIRESKMNGMREIRMIDILNADRVEFTVDGEGKVWVKVDEICLLRIGKVKEVKYSNQQLKGLVDHLVEAGTMKG